MKIQSRKILISPLFLLGLFLLLLNDFVLKAEFHNFFTGKLSDFAGLFVFALFWTAFFPKRKLFIFVSTAAFFVFWKSPYSEGFIRLWNDSGLFGIGRTVDYGDLIALAVLPLAWLYSEKPILIELPEFSRRYVLTIVAFVSLFAFTATAPARMNQMEEYEQVYKFQNSPLEIAKKLQELKTNRFSQTKTAGKEEKYFNVELSEQICDGFPDAGFVVSGGDKAEIKLNSILYPCKDKLPDQADKLRQIFEADVINFLKDQRP